MVLQIKKFYQSRKSQRTVTVVVTGDTVPLYGSGAGLSSSTGTTTVPVALNLNFVVRSRANVLGKLVKTKFYRKIQCSVAYDPKKINVPISLKNSCTYDWLQSTKNKNWCTLDRIFILFVVPFWLKRSNEDELQLSGQLLSCLGRKWGKWFVDFLAARRMWKLEDTLALDSDLWLVSDDLVYLLEYYFLVRMECNSLFCQWYQYKFIM